jgi:hypothetical protein
MGLQTGSKAASNAFAARLWKDELARSAKRYWTFARAWLYRELSRRTGA